MIARSQQSGQLHCLLRRCNRFPNGSAHSQTAHLSTAVQPGSAKAKDINKYSKTVLLPNTAFDQRANAIKKEPMLQKFWSDNKTYSRLQHSNQGEKFVLHDGPPYANGNLHIGHALNKILKDFINRYHILKGRRVHFVPGWDCHGLPIELKVLQDMKSADRQKTTPIQLRKKAAEFAKKTVSDQRESFQRYGVWADWEAPYLTLQPQYEAAQIRVFADMVANGHIYRGRRPVNWSPSSRTALAEAELEYPESHVSRSAYLGFRVTTPSAPLARAIGADASENSGHDVRVAVWTTTPWTIPANTAVAVNPLLEYAVVHHAALHGGAKFLVALELIDQFTSKLGLAAEDRLSVSAVLSGCDLVGTQYQHPLYAERVCGVVAGGDYINTTSGTGLVHTAPGHGQEDYLTGLKHGLDILSPVDDAGCFTDEAGPRFAGLDVLGKGNAAVLAALDESGSLLCEEAYQHKYPHDWRTKKPTICRMTEQWFASVSRFKEASLAAIGAVTWIPAAGRNRIAGMVESRGEWCISRQRAWGVPIPVFYRKSTGEPLMTADTIGHIAQIIEAQGADAWWELSVGELLPAGPLRDSADEYVKGTDTMDVWFDSGTSWAGVVRGREELRDRFPADLYLEGSDQHRGWFQSSLLTAVATQGVAPYRSVLTHGFVLDERGHKMSKSLGNVVDPRSVIEGGPNAKEQPAYGADTLRLWVSGVDYAGDAMIGAGIMKHVSENYRKLRNTLRFLLGSLSDFDPARDSVPYDQLPSFDKNALGRLSALAAGVDASYADFQFYKVSQALGAYANLELSAFYLVSAKDRLYVSRKADARRKSCQTVLHHMLQQMLVLVAPVLPHLAEEAWQSLPYKPPTQSVFENGWIKPEHHFPEHDAELWTRLRLVRDDVNQCIELARAAKLVGAFMECKVYLHATDAALQDTLVAMRGDDRYLARSESTNGVDDLRFLFTASQVVVAQCADEVAKACPEFHLSADSSVGGVTVGVVRATGHKCNRCWLYCDSVGAHHTHTDLCLRCADVVDHDWHTLN